MRVLALDVGTSGARAMAFDAALGPVPGAMGATAWEPMVAPDGAAELDPEATLDAVAAAVDRCLAGMGGGAGIEAVGLSVFWHSLLAVDARGAPLTRVLTWADTRSAAAARALGRELDAAAIHAATGAPLHSTFFPAKLRWLRQARPEAWRAAARFLGFAEYLLARLCGEPRQSLSMASGTGLLDHARLGWHEALLDRCGVDPARLGPIDDAPLAGLRPEWARRWPALARRPWYPAWGDGAASSLGSGCDAADCMALNIGTSAALRLVLPATAAPPPEGLWHYRVDRRRSLVGGALNEGGNVVAWCRRHLALPRDPAALERAIAAQVPGAHGLSVLPFLAGERAPGWRAEARASVVGLTLATSGVDIVRAFMEAVACRLALVHERLAPLARPGHQVIASGGAPAASPAWAGMLADALGVPVTVDAAPHASTRGAAIRALEGLGLPVPPARSHGRVHHPDPGRHAVYAAMRERLGRLYREVVTAAPVLRQ